MNLRILCLPIAAIFSVICVAAEPDELKTYRELKAKGKADKIEELKQELKTLKAVKAQETRLNQQFPFANGIYNTADKAIARVTKQLAELTSGKKNFYPSFSSVNRRPGIIDPRTRFLITGILGPDAMLVSYEDRRLKLMVFPTKGLADGDEFWEAGIFAVTGTWSFDEEVNGVRRRSTLLVVTRIGFDKGQPTKDDMLSDPMQEEVEKLLNGEGILIGK
jgi:hypothetical protein